MRASWAALRANGVFKKLRNQLDLFNRHSEPWDLGFYLDDLAPKSGEKSVLEKLFKNKNCGIKHHGDAVFVSMPRTTCCLINWLGKHLVLVEIELLILQLFSFLNARKEQLVAVLQSLKLMASWSPGNRNIGPGTVQVIPEAVKIWPGFGKNGPGDDPWQ